MLRVMLVTNLCDFARGQVLGVRCVLEFRDTCATAWKSGLRDREGRIGVLRFYVARVLLFCCVVQLAACSSKREPSPEIVNEINALEQRTVSPDGSLQMRASITQRRMSIEAEWQIHITSTPKDYFDWIKHELGTDFQVVSQTGSVLIMGETLPGDSYTLDFKSSLGSTIDVHFVAMGD